MQPPIATTIHPQKQSTHNSTTKHKRPKRDNQLTWPITQPHPLFKTTKYTNNTKVSTKPSFRLVRNFRGQNQASTNACHSDHEIHEQNESKNGDHLSSSSYLSWSKQATTNARNSNHEIHEQNESKNRDQLSCGSYLSWSKLSLNQRLSFQPRKTRTIRK
ncbi:hypothetical protein FHS27_000339 [Rhodopirellula rubra]|uniref:Uncharacterized protein n=1 Tax=Aporhodopirellula rubra TaxID=980271 RepID=A0A7W5DUG2_9BACT|nr:hypothetical protein [Aporhodopirellula rubra]